MLLLFLIFPLQTVNSAEILGFFMEPVYGHQVVYQRICQELSLRGHKVTFVSPNLINDKSLRNLTEIHLPAYQILKKYQPQTVFSKDLSPYQVFLNNFKILDEVANSQLNYSRFVNFVMDKSVHFDLILVDGVHPVVYGLSHRFQAPTIKIFGNEPFSFGYDAVGNPNYPAFIPEPYLNFSPGRMSLSEKLQNFVFFLWTKYYYHFKVVPQAHTMAKTLFGKDLPYIGDLERNISMFFINRNLMLHPPRPNVPAILEISPLAKTPRPPLPQDLKKFLDKAVEGVVYVSFGEDIKPSLFPKKLQKNIVNAFYGLPYKVLLKWDSDLVVKPPNVVTEKKFPQKDVLAHPNVKVFVTQGGLQSIEEAIAAKVPLVGIPFIKDQPSNVRRIVELGIGEELDSNYLTSSDLKNQIIKVAETASYKENLTFVEDILFDTLFTGLESAVWWSEFVIRHKGAPHLRCPSVDMPWYQYLLVDVISFLIFCTLMLGFVTFKVFKTLRYLMCKRNLKEKRQ